MRRGAGDSHKQRLSYPLGVIIQWGRHNKHANRVISDTDHTEGNITVMENDSSGQRAQRVQRPWGR